jgi:beta-lactamase regulating signal transducer with metallopeptidase domain
MTAPIDAINRAAETWSGWTFASIWQVGILVAVILLITRFQRKTSAAFRHMLWLIVFLKLAFPPALPAPWSIGTVIERTVATQLSSSSGVPIVRVGDFGVFRTSLPDRSEDGAASTTQIRFNWHAMAMSVWSAVAISLLAFISLQSRRYTKRLMADTRLPGPIVSEIARNQAQRLGMKSAFEVVQSDRVRIPSVFGFWRPIILLPADAESALSREQLAHLLGHELAHIKRQDIRIGWLVTILVCLNWFNPFVWLASIQLRREREMACDDAVLFATKTNGREYASTIVRMAESFDGATPAGAGFLGILEISDHLLQRTRSVLDPARLRRMGPVSAAFAVVVAIALVPMGAWTYANAQPAPKATPAIDAVPKDENAPPVIVSTSPTLGDTEVDPALTEISVTFDRDMAGGMSWTGGGDYYPKFSSKPFWKDKRTCVMPISLESGRLYRVGINSKSFQNFQSEKGVPVAPNVIAFTTEGADPALKAGVKRPIIVRLSPANGAKEVDPSTTEISVEFDQPMGGGMSWTGGGNDFPETTDKARWSEDKQTCTLPVLLKPSWTYHIGLNHVYANNFQNAYGIPLQPTPYTFTTRGK